MQLFSPPEAAQRLGGGTSLIAVAAAIALLYYGRDFFVTLLVSSVLAFILDPLVVGVTKLRIPRAAATAIVLAVALAGAYVSTIAIWSQVKRLADDLPAYSARLGEVWNKTNDRLDGFEKQGLELLVPKQLRPVAQTEAPRPAKPKGAATPAIQEVRIHNDPRPFLATLYGYVSGYFHVLVIASFIPFLVYFMLSWRDHIAKGVLRLFQGDQRYVAWKAWSGIGECTRAYVLGNFFLWIFLSSFSALAFFFLGVPYWALIGPLSAFFSLVPYVGLPLSIAPPALALLALPINLKILTMVVLITAVLHIVAMNFLYPKVIGSRVRLNPLAVTIALMFWGVIWGGIGLILAVPITAAVKAVCDNIESLEPYGDLLGD